MGDESKGKRRSHPPQRPYDDDTPSRPLASARAKHAQQQQREGCRRRRGTTTEGDKDSPLTHPEPDRPYEEKIVFTFVSPWGLANPLTRAYSRLLGPCFKTGRVSCRSKPTPRIALGTFKRGRLRLFSVGEEGEDADPVTGAILS
ncbi:UNVERIFIED_CONTAM: hypothetical protein RMT77_019907 [Armadillidium vulgare]